MKTSVRHGRPRGLRRFAVGKINSIGYGSKVLWLATLFLAGLPIGFYILGRAFYKSLFSSLTRISLLVGGLLLLSLLILLCVELHQDKKLNEKYAKLKFHKLPLSNGEYECQSCGNRRIGKRDTCCGVCGIRFAAPE